MLIHADPGLRIHESLVGDVDLVNSVVEGHRRPLAGFHSVLVSVCDQSSCTEREVDLEVMALPDLVVEAMEFSAETMPKGTSSRCVCWCAIRVKPRRRWFRFAVRPTYN